MEVLSVSTIQNISRLELLFKMIPVLLETILMSLQSFIIILL